MDDSSSKYLGSSGGRPGSPTGGRVTQSKYCVNSTLVLPGMGAKR